MAHILIAGLVNIETTLKVADFPIQYSPVVYNFNGIESSVSGVGFNLARALTTLGHAVELLSLVGADAAGAQAQAALAALGLKTDGILAEAAATAQSVIIYDQTGRRQAQTDLKNIQDLRYPDAPFQAALAAADLCLLCNINFTRPLLAQAQAAGKLIATDVHTISQLDDPYNSDYLAAADILFMSDEQLPVAPAEWADQVMARYRPEIVVIGLGRRGALLRRRDQAAEHVPAVRTRPVVSTVGAGDALQAAFLHGYLGHGDPLRALQKAVLFASYKIGTAGAAAGFLTAAELDERFTYRQYEVLSD